jgi:hypothetical protein
VRAAAVTYLLIAVHPANKVYVFYAWYGVGKHTHLFSCLVEDEQGELGRVRTRPFLAPSSGEIHVFSAVLGRGGENIYDDANRSVLKPKSKSSSV